MKIKHFTFVDSAGRTKRRSVAIVGIDEYDGLFNAGVGFSINGGLPTLWLGGAHAYMLAVDSEGVDYDWRRLRDRQTTAGHSQRTTYRKNRALCAWPKDELGCPVDAVSMTHDVRMTRRF